MFVYIYHRFMAEKWVSADEFQKFQNAVVYAIKNITSKPFIWKVTFKMKVNWNNKVAILSEEIFLFVLAKLLRIHILPLCFLPLSIILVYRCILL